MGDNVSKLEARILELESALEDAIDECGHWRAVAEEYAQRPLEDYDGKEPE